MTTATKNLENDHEYILRLIEIMEEMTQTENPTTSHLEMVVQVIREFADGQHHAKEEQLLFPLMVEKGFSLENGPLLVMLRDHEQGRLFVKGMMNHISLFKTGDKTALKDVYADMLAYAKLLKDHIAKENNVLFRMADQVFTPVEQETLLEKFKLIEQGKNQEKSKREYAAMIGQLAVLYL